MNRTFSEEKARAHEQSMTLLALFIILSLIFGSVLYAWWPRGVAKIPSHAFPELGAAVEGQLPSLAEAEQTVHIPRAGGNGDLLFRLNTNPVFATRDSEGSLRIENPGNNTYPMSVEIYLTKTSECVYSSGGILPNHHISSAKLDVELPKGLHDATAFVNAYNPATGEFNGRAAVKMTIIVMT